MLVSITPYPNPPFEPMVPNRPDRSNIDEVSSQAAKTHEAKSSMYVTMNHSVVPTVNHSWMVILK